MPTRQMHLDRTRKGHNQRGKLGSTDSPLYNGHGGRNSRVQPTAMLRCVQLQGKIPWCAKVSKVFSTQQDAEIPGGAKATIRTMHRTTRNDVELRKTVRRIK